MRELKFKNHKIIKFEMLRYINSFDDFCTKLFLLIRTIHTNVEIKMDNLNFIVLPDKFDQRQTEILDHLPLFCASLPRVF